MTVLARVGVRSGSNSQEIAMEAYNVVRFKVKPGQEKAFIDYHKKAPTFAGMLR